MSTPDQEARALARVRDFMYDLGNGTYRVESITRLRADARDAMHHYPIIDRHMTPQQRRVVDDVIAYHEGHVSTHCEDCCRHHAGCLAMRLRDMEER